MGVRDGEIVFDELAADLSRGLHRGLDVGDLPRVDDEKFSGTDVSGLQHDDVGGLDERVEYFVTGGDAREFHRSGGNVRGHIDQSP